MIRHLAPMPTCRTLFRHAAVLPGLLLACWHAALCAEDELWAKPVAVGGRWQLHHQMEAGAPALELVIDQDYGRLHGRAHDGRLASGSVDGHRIRFRLHCTGETTACYEEHYDGHLAGAHIDGTLRRGKERFWFRAHIAKGFSLTFDDGPVSGRTTRVLSQLALLKSSTGRPVKAAFFFVADAPVSAGDRLAYYAPYEMWREKGSVIANPQLAQATIDAGHYVGNHGYHHSWPWWPWHGDDGALSKEISDWETQMRDSGITGYAKLYRPPYLSRYVAQEALAGELGYTTVFGYATGDAEPGATVASVQQRALTALEYCTESNCALLFHDIRPVTWRHLSEVVAYLQQQGFALLDFAPPSVSTPATVHTP